jgi:hypothetical protein
MSHDPYLGWPAGDVQDELEEQAEDLAWLHEEVTVKIDREAWQLALDYMKHHQAKPWPERGDFKIGTYRVMRAIEAAIGERRS